MYPAKFVNASCARVAAGLTSNIAAYRPSVWQVKRLLIEERVPGASAVARFVAVEAYEADRLKRRNRLYR